MITPRRTNVRSGKGLGTVTKEEAKKMISSLSRMEKEELYRLAKLLDETRKDKHDKRKEEK
jgi:hypothetical protein